MTTSFPKQEVEPALVKGVLIFSSSCNVNTLRKGYFQQIVQKTVAISPWCKRTKIALCPNYIVKVYGDLRSCSQSVKMHVSAPSWCLKWNIENKMSGIIIEMGFWWEPLNLDLCAKGLYKVMFGRVPSRLDRQGPLGAQWWCHGGGVHIFRELALVGKSVHHRTILR